MMCYDISHVCLVISRLKNIKELDEELSSLHKIPQTHDQNFTLTYNPQENLLDLVNNQTPSKKEIQPSLHNIAHHNHHEERITPKAIHILRRRRIIARISKISQM